MVWGKLLGATAANWFGALVCLPVHRLAPWRGCMAPGQRLLYGVILLSLGVFAQAVALLSSLVLIRRQTGNWRLDTFLCQVAGIGAAFAYYSLWNSIRAFRAQRHGERRPGGAMPSPWAASIWCRCCCSWAGRWWAAGGRCAPSCASPMGPMSGWPIWPMSRSTAPALNPGSAADLLAQVRGVPAGTVPLALAGLTLLASTYGMVSWSPRIRCGCAGWASRCSAGRVYASLPGAGLLDAELCRQPGGGIGSGAVWAGTASLSLTVLAMLGFLTRDICIFLLARLLAGAKGDFAALAILAALYLMVPSLLWQAHLSFLLLPSGHDSCRCRCWRPGHKPLR